MKCVRRVSKGHGDRFLVPILERLRGEKSLRAFSFERFEKQRDLVGAMNIQYTPVIDGNSQSA